MEAKKLKKMMEESRNGVPRDKNGGVLKIGQVVKAEVIIVPPRVELNGKKFFLGPAVNRICGKLIMVGLRDSTIQPMGERERRVPNDKITIIA